jgi:N-acetylmuramoyl-L-alanine amidase
MQLDISYRSPNYGARGTHPIRMVVLHATVGSARSALAWLTNRAARVSAHYLIDKTGHVYQLVPDEYAAWHAGNALWKGETAINECSIGIELENANNGRDPYPPTQLDALLELTRDLISRYQIAPEMITRHADVAQPAGRKSDPAGFPWAAFREALFGATPAQPEQHPRPEPPGYFSSELAQLLLSEAYRQVGSFGQQYWGLARTAATLGLGMPIGPTFDLIVDRRLYTAQSFGRDTLVCPAGEWRNIMRLSELRGANQRLLRNELLATIYERAGATYRTDWAIHQAADRLDVGPPLSDGRRITVAGQEYVAACYALDILYSPVNRWSTVSRLSTLHVRETALQEALYNEWCSRIGVPLRHAWSFQQEAINLQLGAPLGPSFRVSVDQRDYAAASFALDVLVCEIGEWESIHRLRDLLTDADGGTTPTTPALTSHSHT